MTVTVTMGRQGRIVIPADVRRELDLNEGDQIDLNVSDLQVTLRRRPTPAEAARSLRGFLVGTGRTSPVDDLIAERRAEQERE